MDYPNRKQGVACKSFAYTIFGGIASEAGCGFVILSARVLSECEPLERSCAQFHRYKFTINAGKNWRELGKHQHIHHIALRVNGFFSPEFLTVLNFFGIVF